MNGVVLLDSVHLLYICLLDTAFKSLLGTKQQSKLTGPMEGQTNTLVYNWCDDAAVRNNTIPIGGSVLWGSPERQG